MGMFGKLKDLVGIEEIEDEDISEEEIKAAAEKMKKEEAKPSEKRTSYQPQSARPDPREAGKVTSMQTRQTVNPMSTTPFKMVVIEPKGFEECPRLVDSLKSRKPIIINLEKIESDSARKIFDFLSGATYALNGNVQKIANNIFVFAPENVDIMANSDNKPMGFGGMPSNIWK